MISPQMLPAEWQDPVAVWGAPAAASCLHPRGNGPGAGLPGGGGCPRGLPPQQPPPTETLTEGPGSAYW